MHSKIVNVLDAMSVMALLGVIGQVLTAWASLLTIIWMTIRIYESKSFARVMQWYRGEKDEGNYDYYNDGR